MDHLVPDEEERLGRAVAAYRGGLYPSVNKAAKDMVVPYKKLQRRNLGVPSRAANGGHNKHFSLGQEKVLTDWINKLIQSGFPPRLDFIRDRANLMLGAQQEVSTVPPRV
ncbi:MAG: Berardinelli-Seip congenital lipodystrophy 2 (seipin), partial [Watsoniomyces obsoletus]